MNVDTNEYSNMHSLTMSMDNIISIEYEIMPSGTEVAMSGDGYPDGIYLRLHKLHGSKSAAVDMFNGCSIGPVVVY